MKIYCFAFLVLLRMIITPYPPLIYFCFRPFMFTPEDFALTECSLLWCFSPSPYDSRHRLDMVEALVMAIVRPSKSTFDVDGFVTELYHYHFTYSYRYYPKTVRGQSGGSAGTMRMSPLYTQNQMLTGLYLMYACLLYFDFFEVFLRFLRFGCD